MAWIVADGFDYYATFADIGRSVWDSLVSAGGFHSGRFGGQAITTLNGCSMSKAFANDATLYVAVAYYHPGALGGTSPDTFITYRDAGTNQCTIVFESGGAITLKRGDLNGTVVATYPAAFAQDVWAHFQIRVVIDPTAGSLTVRKNGQSADTFTATGLNTRTTTNSFANGVLWGGSASGVPYVDDVLFFSGSGAAPNTWVGDVRAICLSPVADTAQKQFTVFPSGTNAGAVDEPIANGDTDYVFDTTLGDADLYDMADLPTTGIQTVLGVVSKIYVKKSDAGARSAQILVKSAATQVTGADTSLSSTYTYLSRVDAVDPATGAAWTVAGINALQMGQKVTA